MDLALYKEFREECDAAYPETVELDSNPPRRRPRGLAIYPPDYVAGFFISSECIWKTFRVHPDNLLGRINNWALRENKGVYFSVIQVTYYDYIICFAHTVDDRRDMEEWREKREEWFDTFCRALELNEKSRTILKNNYKWHRMIHLDWSFQMSPEVSLQPSTVRSET
ncbi:hypothetical protein CC1G_10617 [Coprinopsis cinerea okayama7|uniref:Uncharacterized protein n=1 Tax=Coprinopsis cinerea (strain Okayama-7 / 130 / ATCC MYA-4618 / FGSC 9003) TaxID=240176 RepID=A8P8S2_COPC7|nr:hypothetical protein CC1G_10617 [Coprinopsis cinerea okayama7\|eukprot:XP_001839624.1 hypothetical protein CC1G_10617 [Coprinopsis cinerea okayama7\